MSTRLKTPLQIHNLKEYKELMMRMKDHPERYPNTYDPWYEYNIGIKDVDDPEIRAIFGSNVAVLENLRKYHHRFVYLKYGDHIATSKAYIMTGVQITNEDFYYILRHGHYTTTLVNTNVELVGMTEKWKH